MLLQNKPYHSKAHRAGLRLFFCAFLFSFIGGCGWQLRGYEAQKHFENTLSEVRVITFSRDTALRRRVNAALKRNNIAEAIGADYVLELLSEQVDTQPLAYNNIGTPSQFKLSVAVSYRFSKDGVELISDTKLIGRRNYDFDPNQIIAKDKEQRGLVREIRDELSQRIINNLNAAINQ